tara:strand:+ start:376 stop:1116 length:741 start_codon:yes stop_codon:yes gene_type:complete
MSDSLMNTQAAETTEAAPVEEQRDYVIAEDSQPDRPDWLPEKYSSGEDLAKAYKELESKLGGKEEDIRSKLLEEIKLESFSERPDSSGDYQLPESVDEELAVDSDLLKWWSEHSFENGYSQDEFKKGIEMYAEAVGSNEPDIEAESAKLGDNANDRIQAASMFASKFFPQESMPAIERMCESHEGIIALEAIMESTKDGSFAGNTNPTAGASEQQLREMMNDPRYWKDRDPSYVKQVTDGFQQIYK